MKFSDRRPGVGRRSAFPRRGGAFDDPARLTVMWGDVRPGGPCRHAGDVDDNGVARHQRRVSFAAGHYEFVFDPPVRREAVLKPAMKSIRIRQIIASNTWYSACELFISPRSGAAPARRDFARARRPSAAGATSALTGGETGQTIISKVKQTALPLTHQRMSQAALGLIFGPKACAGETTAMEKSALDHDRHDRGVTEMPGGTDRRRPLNATSRDLPWPTSAVAPFPTRMNRPRDRAASLSIESVKTHEY
jgi:hypothetical protein